MKKFNVLFNEKQKAFEKAYPEERKFDWSKKAVRQPGVCAKKAKTSSVPSLPLP